MTKDELVARFTQIAPFLAEMPNFGWIPQSDTVYVMYDPNPLDLNYKPFTIDIESGKHSDIVYRLSGEVHKVKGTL